LGFSSFSTAPREALDTEAAVVLLAYLVGLPELRLGRFLSVLLHWLHSRHHLLHAAKLHINFGSLEDLGKEARQVLSCVVKKENIGRSALFADLDDFMSFLFPGKCYL
jgi:hypothetical protein